METPRGGFNKNSEERRKKRTKVLFVLLLLLIVIAAGIIIFLRKSDLQITSVTVAGTRALDPKEIEQVVNTSLQGNYGYLIPKSNTLLFSKQKTKSLIMNRYPGIYNVVTKFTDRGSIVVTVSEKESEHMWCTTGACYFIDDAGVVYRDAPLFSDGVYTYFSGSLGTLMPETGSRISSRFVSEPDYKLLLNYFSVLSQFPMVLHEIAIDENRDITIRFSQIKNYKTSNQSVVKVRLDENPRTIITTITLLLADKSFLNALIAKGGDLELIDLRFEGKIFYKFKNATQIDAAATETLVEPIIVQ